MHWILCLIEMMPSSFKYTDLVHREPEHSALHVPYRPKPNTVNKNVASDYIAPLNVNLPYQKHIIHLSE